MNRFVLVLVVVAVASEFLSSSSQAFGQDSTKPNLLREIANNENTAFYRPYNFRFSPDGKYVAAEEKIWEVATGKEVELFRHLPLGARFWAFSPTEKKVALVKDAQTGFAITICDMTNGKDLATMRGPSPVKNGVATVAFSPSGKTMVLGTSYETTVWDMASHKMKYVLSRIPYYDIVFSPDGKLIAAASGKGTNQVIIINAATGKTKYILNGHIKFNRIHSLAFTPNSQTLASSAGTDPAIRLWDMSTGKEMKSIIVPSEEKIHAARLAFNADGTKLAVGHQSGTIRIWDVASRKLEDSFVAHKYWISSIAFSPDGKMLASGGHRDSIKLWANKWDPNVTSKGSPGEKK